MNVYETDVLVIGGGGAATCSAISAHIAGARTMLAVKGRFGVPGERGAGATSNPIADFWTIRTVGPKGSFFNPPDSVYADMIQAGLGMADPALCRIFVDEIGDALNRLQEMGLQFQSKMLAKMDANPGAGNTNSIVAIQKSFIERTRTPVLEHANLTGLIVENNRCLGAVGIDDEARPFVVHAGAVVIATGGVGQLFKYSFNPAGNTGDGYAMALHAGADLFNMEFMQQGLATTWPTQTMIMLYEMKDPYRLLNADGRTFVNDYLPDGVTLGDVTALKAMHWPVSCRDAAIHLDRAIKGEVLANRGTAHDGVFLDLSNATRGFAPTIFEEFMQSRGFNIKHDMVQVQIHHHTCNGGIRIDTDAQTTVEGLFACGEAAGWQGADRLGGTMLGGSQVFGWRAGAKAAKVAAGRPNRTCGQEAVDVLTERLRRCWELPGSTPIAAMKEKLQHTLWSSVIVEKDAEALARACSYIEDDRERLNRDVRIREPIDVVLFCEYQNLLDVAAIITSAARMRTESRGSHYRSDFPKQNDSEWMTNIFVRKMKSEIELRKEWVAKDIGWAAAPGDIRIRPWG